jgi:hypothetical protein
MATIIKQRRDTEANWLLENPVIPDGQLCLDTTNNIIRVGDGVTNYANIPTIAKHSTGAIASGSIDVVLSGDIHTALAGYSPGTHTHSEYALVSHGIHVPTLTAAGDILTVKDESGTLVGSWETPSSSSSSYELPIATASALGGIKVGANLNIDAATGILSASSSGSGGSSTLEGLTDTDTTGVTNHSILKYNSNTSKWEIGTGIYTPGTNIAISAAGVISSTDTKHPTGVIAENSTDVVLSGDIYTKFLTKAETGHGHHVPTFVVADMGKVLGVDSSTGELVWVDRIINQLTVGPIASGSTDVVSSGTLFTALAEFSGTTKGLVPTSTTSDVTQFLRADGSWVVPTDTITTQRAISSTPTDGATETSISSDWAFDNVKTAVPENAVFTDTGGSIATLTDVNLSTAPTSGQVLKWSDTNSEWTPADDVSGTGEGSGTPGGSDTQVQYNNNGSFGGASGLTYNNSNGQVTCNTATGDSLVIGNSTAQTTGTSSLIFSNKDATAFRPIVRLEGSHTDNGGNGEFTVKTYYSGTPHLGLKVDKSSDVYFYDSSAVGKFHWSASNEKLSIDGEIATTSKITSSEFSSTATGVPTITAASNLILDAVGAVVIEKSPLRLGNYTLTELPTGTKGDIVYNSTTNKLIFWDGTEWTDIGTGSSSGGTSGIDWTIDQGNVNIHANNYEDTDTQVIVNDTLISTSTTEALSANQGTVLDGRIDNHGIHVPSTVGSVGKVLAVGSTGNLEWNNPDGSEANDLIVSTSICYILVMGQSNVGAFGDPSYTYTPTTGNIGKVHKWSLNETWVECPAQVSITDNTWGLGDPATETTVAGGDRIPTDVDYVQRAYSGVTVEEYNNGYAIGIDSYTYPSSGVLETTWAAGYGDIGKPLGGGSGGSYLAELGDNIINSTGYDEVRFVNISVGGSSITQWSPDSTIPFPISATSSQISVQDDFNYSASRLLWERVEYAKNLATTQNFNYNYIFWCQGEADNRGVNADEGFWPTQPTDPYSSMTKFEYYPLLKSIYHELENIGVYGSDTSFVLARTSFVPKNADYPLGGYDKNIIQGTMVAFSIFNSLAYQNAYAEGGFDATALLYAKTDFHKRMLIGPNLDLDYQDVRLTDSHHLNSVGMSQIANEWSDIIVNRLYQTEEREYKKVLSKYLLPSLERAFLLLGSDNTELINEDNPIMGIVDYLSADIGTINNWGGVHYRADMQWPRIQEHYYNNPRSFANASTLEIEGNPTGGPGETLTANVGPYNRFVDYLNTNMSFTWPSTDPSHEGNFSGAVNDFELDIRWHYITKFIIHPISLESMATSEYDFYRNLGIVQSTRHDNRAADAQRLWFDAINRQEHEISFGDHILNKHLGYSHDNEYVDGVSLSGSTLTLTRTGTLANLSADLSSLSGGTGPGGGATSIDGLSDAYYNVTTMSLGLGEQALGLEDTSGSGLFNTAIGKSSLSSLTVGEHNTALGRASALGMTTGSRNVAVGTFSLFTNSIGDYNIAVGDGALLANTIGNKNIGIGKDAGNAITIGSNNTIIGDYAGSETLSNTLVIATGTTERLKVDDNGLSINGTPFTGGSNGGASSINELSDGKSVGGSVGLGPYALSNDNGTDNNNVAVGAGGSLGSCSTGYRNVAIGYGSLWANNYGFENTAIGAESLNSVTTTLGNSLEGRRNIGIGYNAGNAITTGSSNTIIGSLPGSTVLTDTVLIGAHSTERLKVNSEGLYINELLSILTDSATDKVSTVNLTLTDCFIEGELSSITTGIPTISSVSNLILSAASAVVIEKSPLRLGNYSAIELPLGTKGDIVYNSTTNSLVFWDGAAWTSVGTGSSSGGGASAIDDLTDGYYNATSVSLGLGTGSLANETGDADRFNVAVGVNALANNDTGYQNTAIGKDALFTNTEGAYSTAVGAGALYSNETGYSNNTAVGVNALYDNTTGYSHVAVGLSALRNNTVGHFNVAVGVNALTSNEAGSYNTAIGTRALFNNMVGDHNGANTATGYESLYYNEIGSNNTAHGWQSLRHTTANYNTAIGSDSQRFCIEGGANTAAGYMALHWNTEGDYNIGIGYKAGMNIRGSNNTIIGWYEGADDVGDPTSFTSNTVVITAGTAERLKIDSDTVVITAGTTERLKVDANNLYINGQVFAGGSAANLDWTIDQGITNIHSGNYTDWAQDQSATAVIHASNYTNTEYSQATSGTFGLVKIGFTLDGEGRNYPVELSSGKMYVNVPWVEGSSGGGSGTPGGSNTQVQFNSNGSFGGDAGLTYNSSSTALSAGEIHTNKILSSGTGIPTITSATNIVLYPTATVVIQDAPLRFGNFVTTALPAGTSGDTAYDSTKGNLVFHNGTGWVDVGTGSSSGGSGSDNYVSGVSLSGSTLTLTRTGTLGNLTADLSSLSGSGSGATSIGELSDGYYHASSKSLGLGVGALANHSPDGQIGYNTAVGHNALNANIGGSGNTALGTEALSNNTIGISNTAIGFSSLPNNLTGKGNTAIGRQTMTDHDIGEFNVAIGAGCLGKQVGVTAEDGTASNNIAIGVSAMYDNRIGGDNTAVGRRALAYSYGNYNVGIGSSAGKKMCGSNNTIIGSYEGTDDITDPTSFTSDTVVIAAGTTERLKVDADNLYINGAIFSGGGGGVDWAVDQSATATVIHANNYTDNNTTYSTATSSTFGLVKIGYAGSGKNYPVLLSAGKMYVNVPWTDVSTSNFVSKTGNSTITGILTANDFVLSSDRRLKTNIKTLNTDSVPLLKVINPVTFNDGDIGFIAQDFEDSVPELVHTTDEGYLALKYSKITALLWKQNQELLKRIEILENK